MTYREKYKVSIPEGTQGAWSVQKFTVSKKDSSLDSALSFGSRGRYVRPGEYTRLMNGRVVVMSDTSDEIRDHMGPISEVKRLVRRDMKPTCLVHGLGLGMVAKAMLDEGAASVLVVEKSPEVIDLVGIPLLKKYGEVRDGYAHPVLKGARVLSTSSMKLTIIEGDAVTWKPPKGSKWDVVWHDIWNTICADNLPEMTKLHRRFGRRSGWQGSWAKELCVMLRDEWKSSPWNRSFGSR